VFGNYGFSTLRSQRKENTEAQSFCYESTSVLNDSIKDSLLLEGGVKILQSE